jgi:hypothetical protein
MGRKPILRPCPFCGEMFGLTELARHRGIAHRYQRLPPEVSVADGPAPTAVSPVKAAKVVQMSAPARKAPDPRHTPVLVILRKYWRAENKDAGYELPWGPADAGALASFLRANPGLSVDGITRLLQHRLASEDHAPGEPVRLWIGSLTRYAGGPLNRYKQPKERRNDGTRADERNLKLADATRAALARL